MTEDELVEDVMYWQGRSHELADDVTRVEGEYQEVARALGCTTFFHADVLARAKELASFARVA